jgi:hypothetical protein
VAYPRVGEGLEELALQLADLLERLDAEEAVAREGVTLVVPQRVELAVGVQHCEVVALQQRELPLRLVRLLAPLHRREEGRARGERRRDRQRLVRGAEAHAVQDELPEPHIDRQLRE